MRLSDFLYKKSEAAKLQNIKSANFMRKLLIATSLMYEIIFMYFLLVKE